jgi:hypothetical protein
MVRILGSHPSDPGSSPGNGSSRVDYIFVKGTYYIFVKGTFYWVHSPSTDF